MIRFKAHPDLASKPANTLAGIEHCIMNGIPFSLYHDPSQYVAFLPKLFKIIQVDGNSFMALDGFNESSYIERIKFYLMAYDQFIELPAARIEHNILYLE